MKINLIKTENGNFFSADEQDYEIAKNLKTGNVYQAEIKLIQNYKLHKKMFAFFKYCAQHYYGDQNVTKDQIEFTRSKLLMAAGYVKQVFYPDGKRFELYPQSMKYENMPPEERSECYKKLVTAACKNIFHSADDATWNSLIRFF